MQKIIMLILFFQLMIIIIFIVIANKKAINYDKLLKERFPERYEKEQINNITDIIIPQKVIDFFLLKDEDKELNNIRLQSKLFALIALLSLFGLGITYIIFSFIFL